MNTNRCPRQDELLDALTRGFIPTDLAAHADACASCRELRLVAGALLDERIQALTEAPVLSAETMWRRLQMRQRQEAQAAAQRSLLIGQAGTLLVALALIISIFGADFAVGVTEVITSIRLSTPLLFALATWLVVAPIAAGYVALAKK